jgi:hypothetical protein
LPVLYCGEPAPFINVVQGKSHSPVFSFHVLY